MIAAADLADAAAILDLQKLAYASEAELYQDFALPPLLQTLPQMQAQFSNHVILKAVRGGVILGSVRGVMAGDTCLVGRLIVHPKAQCQGLGTRLMREIEARFASARRFELFTGHRSAGNLRLYWRLGYREFDRRLVNEGLTLVYLENVKDRPSRNLG